METLDLLILDSIIKYLGHDDQKALYYTSNGLQHQIHNLLTYECIRDRKCVPIECYFKMRKWYEDLKCPPHCKFKEVHELCTKCGTCCMCGAPNYCTGAAGVGSNRMYFCGGAPFEFDCETQCAGCKGMVCKDCVFEMTHDSPYDDDEDYEDYKDWMDPPEEIICTNCLKH